MALQNFPEAFWGIFDGLSFSFYVPSLTHALLYSSLLPLLWYLVAWLLRGRDRPLGPIVPAYAPPDGVSPALAATLLRLQPRIIFAAAVLDLIGRRFLSLENGYLVAAREGGMGPIPEEERELVNALEECEAIALDDEDAFYVPYALFIKKCSALYGRHIRRNRKQVLVGIFFQLAGALLLGLEVENLLVILGIVAGYLFFFWLGFKYSPGRPVVFIFISFHAAIFGGLILYATGTAITLPDILLQELALVAIAGMHVVFFRILDKPNAKTTEILRQLAGYRLFMETVEKNHYALIPEHDIDKNFAFAVVFGLEHRWLDAFRVVAGLVV